MSAPVARSAAGAVASGVTTVLVGGAGVAVGVAAVMSQLPSVSLGWLVPLWGVRLAFDPLGGMFLIVTGAVAAVMGIYTIGYARREDMGTVSLCLIPAFVAAMLVVCAAGTVSTFLWAWELMAGTSLALVATDHDRPRVRMAALTYAVMTQLGFAAILFGLAVLSSAAGTGVFTGIATAHVPAGVRGIVFVATVIGFASKAGLVPLHGWLPMAHPEAPSPVSALMSAAMVNLGIYGLVRFDMQLTGPGNRWEAGVLLVVGAVSAVYGVLQATVATDVKRLLAFSTAENMGLVTVALGAAMLLAATGFRSAAAVATTAAMLHVIGHAAFKTLGFGCAGAVSTGTGLRDLDRLGGLIRSMPATTVLFGVAALGASGLPLGAGFVSEWLLVQSLIHSAGTQHAEVALAMPLTVGAVALTTGLGVAAMTKAFGIGFLARPRSQEAGRAREASATMLVAMSLAAVVCAVVAVAPCTVFGLLRRVLAGLPTAQVGLSGLGAQLHLPGLAGSITPWVVAVALTVAIPIATVWARIWGLGRPARMRSAPLWACGRDTVTARMQYTATSFAEPLQRVFDDVVSPVTDIEITHRIESRYLVDRVSFRSRPADTIAERISRPVVGAVSLAAFGLRRLHPGNVHLYLAYGMVGVLIVVVAAI